MSPRDANQPGTGSSADVVDEIIRTRRTSMAVDPARSVPADLISELCNLASWAPCHKRTWPWRFAYLTGAARQRFGDAVADAMASNGDDSALVLKRRSKYLRTPGVLVVGSASGDTPTRTQENRDATAAAVQNLLLAATARGLATYWSSCPKGCTQSVARFCGFASDTEIVAIVYIGWAISEVDAVERPIERIHHIEQ